MTKDQCLSKIGNNKLKEKKTTGKDNISKWSHSFLCVLWTSTFWGKKYKITQMLASSISGCLNLYHYICMVIVISQNMKRYTLRYASYNDRGHYFMNCQAQDSLNSPTMICIDWNILHYYYFNLLNLKNDANNLNVVINFYNQYWLHILRNRKISEVSL